MSNEMVEPVKREMTEPVYVLRGGVYLLDEHSGVLIDSAGNFSAKTRGNPRALAAILRMVADEIEADVEADDWEDPEECPACDTPLAECPYPAAGCCEDCNHAANYDRERTSLGDREALTVRRQR